MQHLQGDSLTLQSSEVRLTSSESLDIFLPMNEKCVETFDWYHVSDVLNELHYALIQVLCRICHDNPSTNTTACVNTGRLSIARC